MLGDETWLKLFPGMFTRYDGVSSFFVSLPYSWHFLKICLDIPFLNEFPIYVVIPM